MFAVGHLALGYLCGKTTSKILNVKVNLPPLFLASVISDVDLLIPGLEHRGPTHSLILACLIFLPALLLYRKRAIPYFIALTQHFILGDSLTGGGAQLLWPLTTKWYGAHIKMVSQTNILLEWTLFLTHSTPTPPNKPNPHHSHPHGPTARPLQLSPPCSSRTHYPPPHLPNPLHHIHP